MDVWEKRLDRVREAQTDFYFAYNLLYEDFERIVKEILAERGETPDLITFNPELAPQDMLFEQAEDIERMPAARRKTLEARLQEIKVVLIRTMISDQLAYLNIARKWFTVEDLKEIRQRKIGYGKIGGKSAGMMLAYRILRDVAPTEIQEALRIPTSYFLASDMFYAFMATNGLIHWSDQKYKSEDKMRSDYPRIVRDFVKGTFPEDILERLRVILEEAGKRPLIVRSSSLLEDNFGTSFAGKYDSFFCPNQGTPEENLDALTEAIARVYASCVNPNALLYRHQKGLVDYDERIAVLIQFVEGGAVRALFPAAGRGGGLQPQPVPLVAANPQGGRFPAPGLGAGHTRGGSLSATTSPALWRSATRSCSRPVRRIHPPALPAVCGSARPGRECPEDLTRQRCTGPAIPRPARHRPTGRGWFR